MTSRFRKKVRKNCPVHSHSVPQPKILISGFLIRPSHVDPGHVSRYRADAQTSDEILYYALRALGNYLDRTVRHVSDIPADIEVFCLIQDKESVAHTLNNTLDDYLRSHCAIDRNATSTASRALVARMIGPCICQVSMPTTGTLYIKQ